MHWVNDFSEFTFPEGAHSESGHCIGLLTLHLSFKPIKHVVKEMHFFITGSNPQQNQNQALFKQASDMIDGSFEKTEDPQKEPTQEYVQY